MVASGGAKSREPKKESRERQREGQLPGGSKTLPQAGSDENGRKAQQEAGRQSESVEHYAVKVCRCCPSGMQAVTPGGSGHSHVAAALTRLRRWLPAGRRPPAAWAPPWQ